ncbi:TRAP dicarboxylate transporter- DctP subunit [Psychromonas ingrahamii 37]|uniref:TRAP dicarboxylate transporter-DctP subunit n=1 Tax=Psychromonas ingrahamii (strain DSM 17664 / CCUG 51855 / 37) TaxID=357804 RepID=A1SSN6_PSYIN|nr:TRAP transporter substrate-binding protein [Psychromonas ingrahamii]ABM02501.1 TRAP dicarboxylate transporter- DctP subunit [Psychromonas ingrahamii 37]
MFNNLLKTSITGFVTYVCFSSMSWASGPEHVLRVGTWLSPTHTMNQNVLPTWGNWIEEATDGRVTIKLEYDVGHPKSLIDLVEDGAIAASWTFHGYLPGRFLLPQMAELPGADVGAEAASVAHWRINERFFQKSGEYDGVEVAGLFVHGPAQIHTTTPIASIKELKDKKIRVGGGTASEIGERLGIIGVNAPANKAYEMLSQGVADGIFMQMDMMKVGRFKDVAPYTLKIPGGLYLGSFGIFLSPDFMDGLSEKDQAAIRSVSGERLSALAGRSWAEADKIGEADIIASGSQVIDASAEDIAYFNEKIKGMDEQWIKSANSRGVDAEAALKAFRNEAENYQPIDL